MNGLYVLGGILFLLGVMIVMTFIGKRIAKQHSLPPPLPGANTPPTGALNTSRSSGGQHPEGILVTRENSWGAIVQSLVLIGSLWCVLYFAITMLLNLPYAMKDTELSWVVKAIVGIALLIPIMKFTLRWLVIFSGPSEAKITMSWFTSFRRVYGPGLWFRYIWEKTERMVSLEIELIEGVAKCETANGQIVEVTYTAAPRPDKNFLHLFVFSEPEEVKKLMIGDINSNLGLIVKDHYKEAKDADGKTEEIKGFIDNRYINRPPNPAEIQQKYRQDWFIPAFGWDVQYIVIGDVGIPQQISDAAAEQAAAPAKAKAIAKQIKIYTKMGVDPQTAAAVASGQQFELVTIGGNPQALIAGGGALAATLAGRAQRAGNKGKQQGGQKKGGKSP